MEGQSITILEEREELMVSPTGDSIPISRTAHFLKPTLTSIDEPGFELSSLFISTKPTIFNLKELPVKVFFKGWRYPTKKWTTWVASLHCRYQSIWKQAGIYEAIMCSTYKIRVHNELVLGLAERWCPETNTFIFPWGEATITLEDMILSGGYSVLGDSVFSPLETKELLEIDKTLVEAWKEAATIGSFAASYKAWMDYFMNSGHELEHEAFLSLWLSKFVFPKTGSNQYVGKHVFPIAIRLARGITIALAPAVLASIYRDLGFLKKKLFGLTEVKDDDKVLNLYAPLHFVQIWAWERFPTLRPVPNAITYGEPRPALWHQVSNVNAGDVRFVIDSAGESFQWRPCARVVNNWLFPKFYGDKEQWIWVDTKLDKAFESFARCLRVSELVGLGCVEQYNPHRVAMQFGMDQDLPGHVARCNVTPKIAWCDYIRPIRDVKLYIPPRLLDSDVTTRYLEWWKQSVLAPRDAIKPFTRKRRRPRRLPQISFGNKEDYHLSVTPGFSSDCCNVEVKDSVTVLASLSKHTNVANIPAVDLQPLPGCQSRSISTSDCNDGADRKMGSLMKLDTKVVKIESSMNGLVERAVEDAIESEACVKDSERESTTYSKLEIPGLELEVRISRLERLIADRKAERLGNKF